MKNAVIYFGNGALKKDEYVLSNFDSFVGTLKRNVSWTTGVGIWKSDYEKIPEQYLKISKEVKKSDIKKAIKAGERFEGVDIISSPARVAFRLGQESKDYIAEAGE